MAMETEASERTNSIPNEPSFLDTPQGRRLAYHRIEGEQPGVVYIHGLNSNMNGEKATALDSYCRSRGRSFVRFELSGHGRSSGTLQESTVTAWLEDVSAVMETLTHGPQIIIGSSVGGWLMFLFTLRNPDKVCGLIGIATAADYTQKVWKGLDKEKKSEVQRSGVYNLPNDDSPDPIPLSMELFRDGGKYTILDMPGIEIIKAPVWLIHGIQDMVVPHNVSLQLMQRLECPVQLRSIEDGEHRLSRPQDINIIQQALEGILDPSTQVEDDEDED